MANPHLGSVVLAAGDKVYQVSYSINALCELEDAFDGLPVPQIAEKLNDPAKVSLKTVRALIWAGLRDRHEETSIKDAGEIATLAGVPACMDAIGKAFQLAFPEEGNDNARPRHAAKG
jgi:hypothetical protein